MSTMIFYSFHHNIMIKNTDKCALFKTVWYVRSHFLHRAEAVACTGRFPQYLITGIKKKNKKNQAASMCIPREALIPVYHP